ncbi:hypothetical protein FA10DRAFT_267316 [Acaromyces ingoldii]|uniref:MPN domain-containing protein n=1 Tax=Acaromyces ingoldii TaxID=215250 RepID=A0A316YND5_9BASI|nr:hypothetical protein FA10DRAFT_267316 [Acaromyces ingoldii]PWN90887.1 hypothetical protein FA10DRAFT_267316 [Acaromyces ingoldii]
MSRQTQAPSIPSVFRPGQSSASSTSLLSRASSASSASSSASSLHAAPPLTLSELSDIATSGSHASALLIDTSIPIERYLAGADALARHGATLLRRPSPGGENLNEAFISLVKAVRLVIDVLPQKHPGWKRMESEKRRLVLKDGDKYLDELQKCKVAIVERGERWGVTNKEAEDRKTAKRPAVAKPAPSTFSMEQPSLNQQQQQKTNRKEVERSGRALPQPSRSSSTSSSRDASGVDYVKPDRSSGLGGGLDVRDILGYGSASRRKPNPGPVETAASHSSNLMRSPFTSSPLERFQKSHGRTGSNVSSVSYPTLRPAASIRMDKHQVAQGFAPRSERTSRYFQVLPDAAPAATTRLRDSMWGRPAPDRAQSIAMPVPSPAVPPRPLPGPKPGQGPAFPMPANSSVESLATSMAKTSLQQARPASTVVESDALSLFNEDRGSGKDHSTVSSSYMQGQAVTEGGEPLRTLVVPSSLISHFVAIAEPNTRLNLETCGLLMGTIDGQLLQVTNLLIPQQTATSDSCDTVDEASIWSFQESHNLTTFGWAHTHPSQSCFMSSLDLHTHASYQAMLPEAIAIVCAPNDRPSFGVFRLTSPFGLKTILTCKRPELFHPHIDERTGETVKAIYTDAVEGHILLADSPLKITDLRK